MNLNLALTGLQNAGNDLKHRRLAGTVGTNQTDNLATMNIKGDMLKRAELFKEELVLCKLNKVFLEVRQRLRRHIEDHSDVFNLNSKRLLAVINRSRRHNSAP